MERRAFRQAQFALRNDDAALDAVQDAMLKLAEKYSHRPAEEFPMLFQRILQNTVRDQMRRSRVRNLWVSLLSAFGHNEAGEEQDPLETLAVEDTGMQPSSPHGRLAQTEVLAVIEHEIERLPARQREAFLIVTGRNSTLPKPQPPWAARKAVSKRIVRAPPTRLLRRCAPKESRHEYHRPERTRNRPAGSRKPQPRHGFAAWSDY